MGSFSIWHWLIVSLPIVALVVIVMMLKKRGR